MIEKMIKKIFVIIALLINLSAIEFAADPFYTNLLNEGKQKFLAGKYDEALESFRLAEFGLIDEREYVPNLYFFYALAQYKKGGVAESRELLEKMKLALGVEDLSSLVRPKEIEREISIMVRVLTALGKPGAKTFSPAFGNAFYETWDLISQSQIPQAEAGLKKLNKLGSDEGRIAFLEGFLAFQKEDYKKCVSRLGKKAASLPDELSEDASFYLAFSHLKRGDAESAKKYSQKIKNPTFVHRLMLLIEEAKAKTDEKIKKDQ